MANLGYTVIHVEDLQEAVQVYRLLPNLVRIVIVDDWDSFLCWKDKQGCLRTEQNPTGIPGYKVRSLDARALQGTDLFAYSCSHFTFG